MCRPAGEESHDERDAGGVMPPGSRATMLLRLARRFDDVVADPGAPSWCWTMVKAKRIVIGTIVRLSAVMPLASSR